MKRKVVNKKVSYLFCDTYAVLERVMNNQLFFLF